MRAAVGKIREQSVRVHEQASRAVKPLTSREVRQFSSQGFLVLPQFCGHEELTRIHAQLSRLVRTQAGRAEGKHFDMLGLDADGTTMRQPQLLHPSEFVPELLESQHYRKIAAIAEQLLGAGAHFSFDHCIVKPPHSAAGTPWHQDEAHHDQRMFRYRQISFWMPLQDTPKDSGCMRYVPGSHRRGVLPHESLHGDPRIHAMECPTRYFDESRAIVTPADAGTCILHDGRTLHGALPNVSTVDRMAYIIAFVGPPLLSRSPPPARSRHLPRVRTASMDRRRAWLWQGGFLKLLWRRLRTGLRSNPGVLWSKAKLLLRVWLGGTGKRDA